MGQPLLSQTLEAEVVEPGEELEGIHEELAQLHQRVEGLEALIQAIRAEVDPWARFRRGGSGPAAEASSPSSVGGNPKWEMWKRRFPGRVSEVIDLLLVQGSMNQSQLCAVLKCDSRTLSAKMIYPLNKAGLLNKNGGMFSLKEL